MCYRTRKIYCFLRCILASLGVRLWKKPGQACGERMWVRFLRIYFIFIIFICTFMSPCVKETFSFLCLVYWWIIKTDLIWLARKCYKLGQWRGVFGSDCNSSFPYASTTNWIQKSDLLLVWLWQNTRGAEVLKSMSTHCTQLLVLVLIFEGYVQKICMVTPAVQWYSTKEHSRSDRQNNQKATVQMTKSRHAFTSFGKPHLHFHLMAHHDLAH